MKTRLVFALVAALVLLSFVAILSDRAEQNRRRSRLGGGPFLANFTAASVSRLEIRKAADMWRTAKVGDLWRAWHLNNPGGSTPDFLADFDAIQNALEQLADLDRSNLVSSNRAKHADLAVDEQNPEATLVDVWTDPDAPPAYRLIIGKSSPDHASNFFRLLSEDSVFRSKRVLDGVFHRGETGWRDRTIVRVAAEDVVELELANGDETVVLRRSGRAVADRTWRIVQPEESAADSDTVESILRNLTSLTADTFPATADPLTTGLPLSTERCRFSTEDGNLNEIVWGKEVDSKVFVQKASDETVFGVFSFKKSAIQKRLDQMRAKVPVGEAEAPAPE